MRELIPMATAKGKKIADYHLHMAGGDALMYRVYCDGLPLYNDRLESLQILSPTVELEENKTGSFAFTLPADHPYYGLVKKLKSIVTVYQDDYLLFRGRVLDEETGWHNEKKISCEGELAFLLDSIQRPYDYTGTVAGFLNLLIDRHNAQVEETKWFTVGNITVTDNNDYIVRSNIDYTDTWTELQDKLVKLMGGYVSVRHEGYINYIDYLQDSTVLSPQAITFGKNLLDLKRVRNGADIATAVIPLGAKLKDAEGKDTDTRLTVKSVNDDSDTIQNPLHAGVLLLRKYSGRINPLQKKRTASFPSFPLPACSRQIHICRNHNQKIHFYLLRKRRAKNNQLRTLLIFVRMLYWVQLRQRLPSLLPQR